MVERELEHRGRSPGMVAMELGTELMAQVVIWGLRMDWV